MESTHCFYFHLIATDEQISRGIPSSTSCIIIIFYIFFLRSLHLTPSLPQPVKFPSWYTLAYKIFDGLITNLLLILWVLIEILSRNPAKGAKSANFESLRPFCPLQKGLNDFKVGTFVGHFRSDKHGSERVNTIDLPPSRQGDLHCW